MYQKALGDIDSLVLPAAPDVDERHFDVYQNYEMESGHRDALREYLADRGVGTIIQWGGTAVHQLKGLGFDDVHLPVTDKMTERFLMLPMHTALSNEDVEYICDCILEFHRSTDYTD
jgi:dTDP-4-amino-4,6-dideoxygalactose transaminase